MQRRGFTLIELLVAMGLLALIVVGFLSLFDSSVKISKAQSATADVQESLRYVMGTLVKISRMAGAGGIPAMVRDVNPGAFRPGAVAVMNNVGQGANPIRAFGGRSPIVGTDVLELRGAFTPAVYDIVDEPGNQGSYVYTGPNGQIQISPRSRTGDAQATGALDVRLDSTLTPPLWAPVVFSAFGADTIGLESGHERDFGSYGVALAVEKYPSTMTYDFTTNATWPRQQYFLDLNPGGVYPDLVGAGSGTNLRVSIINDITYFVALDDDGVPTLYQYDIILDRSEPVASDIIDLQVELGCDLNVNGQIESLALGAGDDEWVLNFVGETTVDTSDPNNVSALPAMLYLRELRLNLVGRIPAGDMRFQQRPNGSGSRQNEFYFADGRDLLADPPYRTVNVRNFRYRVLTERVKLRSIGPIK